MMDAKFITGKQAVESGIALFKDLLEAVAKGSLTAYAETGSVTICTCHEDNGAYPDSFPVDKWGKFKLTDAEYCGKPESHDYELYLGICDIEHTRTKARHPQTNGICERFHKTILQEFYQMAFRKKIYRSLEELQSDLDEWLDFYNNERTHQGKMCCGRTPMQTFLDGKKIWEEKVGQLNLSD